MDNITQYSLYSHTVGTWPSLHIGAEDEKSASLLNIFGRIRRDAINRGGQTRIYHAHPILYTRNVYVHTPFRLEPDILSSTSLYFITLEFYPLHP